MSLERPLGVAVLMAENADALPKAVALIRADLEVALRRVEMLTALLRDAEAAYAATEDDGDDG